MVDKKNFDMSMHYFRGIAILLIVVEHAIVISHGGGQEWNNYVTALFISSSIFFVFI